MKTEPKIIQLKKIPDERGNLSVIEERKDIPFKIERTYWIYDVPGGAEREGHAYFENEEFIVCLSGSFEIMVNTGSEEKTFTLNRANKGLFVPKLTWRKLDNFSTNTVALIIASKTYNEQDYIRSFSEFLNLQK